MKRLAVIGVLVGALVFAGSAAAYVERPGVGEAAAEQRVAKFLRTYPGWRYREDGFIDCWRGRINGYTWGCRVAWWSGRRCRQGRIRITNEYSERGVTYYQVNASVRRCYR